MAMGLNWHGESLFAPVEESALSQALIDALAGNAETVGALTAATAEAVSFKGEVERTITDLSDPRAAGWTFLINSEDSQRNEITEILRPLAEHRGMDDPAEPLYYNGEDADEFGDWLSDNYYALEIEGQRVPQYFLIVGGPEQVPFRIQSILATLGNVGRVAFDSLTDLQTYVDKLIGLEAAPEPPVEREVLLFAPDGGISDPTHFSRLYMVQPLAEHIRDDLGFATHTLIGEAATKAALAEALRTHKPALVYTASHGLGATDEPLDFQKQVNGAICCQHTGPLGWDALFSAADVEFGKPVLEGAVFFQFACFGYGTPAESDYAHWFDGVPQQYTSEDFVAALPKRLLAHPRGPVAFVGHLDTAFLHAFTDADDPHILDRWHPRMAPFRRAVDGLLGVEPSGRAMEMMNTRYGTCNAIITNTYDRQKRGKLKWTAERAARFLDNWIVRSDAQNYMVFGDPGAHLRIPAP